MPTRVTEGVGWANPDHRGEAGPTRVTEGRLGQPGSPRGGCANPGHRGEAVPTRVTEGRQGQPGSPRGVWANPSNRELKLVLTWD